MVAVFHHIAVCPDNRHFLRHSFHTWGVKSIIEALRCGNILDRIKDLLAKETDIELVNPPSEKNSISFPNLELHLRKQTVKWQGQLIHLTHLEFFTLAYLARHPGWVYTQEQIYEAVCGTETNVGFPKKSGSSRKEHMRPS